MAPAATSRPVRRRRSRRSADTVTGQLRVHDPFELIRWLALSQPDPRKALAELIQNSLDAGAKTIRVTRIREKGIPAVRILDDGSGIIPELDRPEALKYVATHIGHSRKRDLSPQQRLELMTQGQYGIGLLGFWSLGEVLEMRSSLPGQKPHRLVLYRDRPDYLIEPIRWRLALDETFTEVVVSGLHREALPALAGGRIADFLAAELRGQLLSRGVDLTIEDRISRGLSRKLIAVRPPRFLGERLEAFSRLEVLDYPSARLELYLRGSEADPETARGVALYAAGTLVAEGFHELGPLGLDHSPWTNPRLTGLVDFFSLTVAPGSRRGVVPDKAAGALATALAGIEPALDAVLLAAERRREAELDRNLVRELQRAFRDFFRHRPRYSSLPVTPNEPAEGSGGPPEPPPDPLHKPPHGEPARDPDGAIPLDEPKFPPPPALSVEPAFLFPPGPLAAVETDPDRLRVPAGTRRRVTARAVDVSGRAVTETVSYDWSASPGLGTLETNAGSATITFVAGAEPGIGWLQVVVRGETGSADARVETEVTDPPGPRGAAEGIPEPELLDAPGASWRSRLSDGRWQVNAGHRDYRALQGRPLPKLRYLALLFAKEVVLRSAQDPRFEEPLEQLVEVAAYADRNLARKARRRATGKESDPGAEDV